MSIDSKHPLYSEFYEDWRTCRDAYRGERAVKAAGETYLPKTQAMKSRQVEGQNMYDAYKMRACFYEFLAEAVESSIGALHQKEAVISLPKKLEPLRKIASTEEESLLQVLRRVNTEQLVTGRVGVLLDLPDTPVGIDKAVPYLSLYDAERIINWDEGRYGMFKHLRMVVLDESGPARVEDDFFGWEHVNKYRVLAMSSDGYVFGVFDEKEDETGRAGFNFSPSLLRPPSVLDNNAIPFTFINSQDLCARPDDPPLVGLARLSMAIYRSDADHRQHLFFQGQDTLVIKGGDEEETYETGAGAVIVTDLEGDAKYIGVNSQGLPERRAQMQDDKNRADRLTGRLIHAEKSDRESGEALRARQAAQTATLIHIALAGAAGLERILKRAAAWVGADPEEVVVTPNMDFTNDIMPADEFVKLVMGIQQGAPLSMESLHRLLRDRGLTIEDYEEEMRKRDAERAKEQADAAKHAESIAKAQAAAKPAEVDLDEKPSKSE